MRLRSFLSVVTLVAMSATSAFAADSGVSFTAEPYVGYGLIGSTSIERNGITADLGSYTGFGFGARGLVNFAQLFFAGIDISYYPSYSYGQSSNALVTSKLDSGTKNFKGGLVGGVALPKIPFRFWFAINVIDKMSDTLDSGADATLKGVSAKVGAGYCPIPLLSINLEYIHSRYGTYESTQGGVTTKIDSDFTATHDMVMLSASVPFTF